MIAKEIYEKYNINSLENELSLFGDTDNTRVNWYRTFLMQTDHIPNKIIESQVLGKTIEDYVEILDCRQFARDEINRLNGGV